MVILILIGVGVVLVAAPVLFLKHHAGRHGLGPVLWRLFTVPTGIDGRYHTDRGWFTSHTRVLHPSGRAGQQRRLVSVSSGTGPVGLLAAALGAASDARAELRRVLNRRTRTGQKPSRMRPGRWCLTGSKR